MGLTHSANRNVSTAVKEKNNGTPTPPKDSTAVKEKNNGTPTSPKDREERRRTGGGKGGETSHENLRAYCSRDFCTVVLLYDSH